MPLNPHSSTTNQVNSGYYLSSKVHNEKNEKKTNVGTVLIFQFSSGFGSEALVTAVSRYWFWYLGSGSYFSIPGFGTRF